MNLTEFAKTVAQKVQETLGDDYTVEIHEQEKNNSVKLTGIQINDGSNISPVIYIDKSFEVFGENTDEATNEVLRAYSANRIPNFKIDISSFKDWEWVKKRLFCKLVNTAENKERLEQIPHDSYMDLSVIFAVSYEADNEHEASVVIRNEHLDSWGITVEDLKEAAYINAPVMMPYEFRTMAGIMAELTGMEIPEIEEGPQMFVLTNTHRCNGAAVIAYSGLLEKMARGFGKGFYIIPSSIHEVLIIPECEEIVPEFMRGMIADVNNTQLSKEEILSYNLYRYDLESGLRIA